MSFMTLSLQVSQVSLLGLQAAAQGMSTLERTAPQDFDGLENLDENALDMSEAASLLCETQAVCMVTTNLSYTTF